MKRLAELEHDVVRDVHDVRDRPHARGDEAPLHPLRRRTDANAIETRDREAPARIGILNADVQRFRRLRPEVRLLGLVQRRFEQRGDLARDAEDAEAVRPVRL